jgi:hypothetical protein
MDRTKAQETFTKAIALASEQCSTLFEAGFDRSEAHQAVGRTLSRFTGLESDVLRRIVRAGSRCALRPADFTPEAAGKHLAEYYF